MGSLAIAMRPPGLPTGVAAFLALLLLSGGCATLRNTAAPPRSSDVIVLLPDDRGKTGAITVSGPGGSELLLSKPGQAVEVTPGAGPGEPRILPQRQVQAMVGPALDSLPPRPVQYVFYFVRDDAVLTPESGIEMRKALQSIARHGPVEISVVGHTDTVGTRSYNRRLGLERARAVAGLLAKTGIDSSILEISSHGENNPLAPTGDEVPEPRNRRVELTVR